VSDTDWIEWNGGECPVDPDAKVAVRLRCGDPRPPSAAKLFRWRHLHEPVGEQFDIIAYRVVQS
jgi:hypothetical protein